VAASNGRNNVVDVVRTCCDWLDRYALQEYGVWQQQSSIQLVQILEKRFNSGLLELPPDIEAHTVTGVLIRWMKLLPGGFFSAQQVQQLVEVRGSLPVLQKVISELPPPVAQTLQYLVHHWRRVWQADNGVDAKRIANAVFMAMIVMNNEIVKELENLEATIQLLIASEDDIFPIGRSRVFRTPVLQAARMGEDGVAPAVQACCSWLDHFGLQVPNIWAIDANELTAHDHLLVQMLEQRFNCGLLDLPPDLEAVTVIGVLERWLYLLPSESGSERGGGFFTKCQLVQLAGTAGDTKKISEVVSTMERPLALTFQRLVQHWQLVVKAYNLNKMSAERLATAATYALVGATGEDEHLVTDYGQAEDAECLNGIRNVLRAIFSSSEDVFHAMAPVDNARKASPDDAKMVESVEEEVACSNCTCGAMNEAHARFCCMCGSPMAHGEPKRPAKPAMPAGLDQDIKRIEEQRKAEQAGPGPAPKSRRTKEKEQIGEIVDMVTKPSSATSPSGRGRRGSAPSIKARRDRPTSEEDYVAMVQEAFDYTPATEEYETMVAFLFDDTEHAPTNILNDSMRASSAQKGASSQDTLAAIKAQKKVNASLRELFKLADKDSDGTIDTDECEAALTPRYAARLIQLVNQDDTHKITLEEMKQYLATRAASYAHGEIKFYEIATRFIDMMQKRLQGKSEGAAASQAATQQTSPTAKKKQSAVDSLMKKIDERKKEKEQRAQTAGDAIIRNYLGRNRTSPLAHKLSSTRRSSAIRVRTRPGTLNHLATELKELQHSISSMPSRMANSNPMLGMKDKAAQKEAEIKAIHEQHVNRKPCTGEYLKTWETEEELGLSLQDGSSGVMVCSMAIDADEHMPDIVGMSVVQVNSASTDGKNACEVVSMVRECWPVTIRFRKGTNFEHLDIDGDGKVSEEEYKRQHGGASMKAIEM